MRAVLTVRGAFNLQHIEPVSIILQRLPLESLF